MIVLVAGAIIMRRTHIPVLAAMVALPVVSWVVHEPLLVTMGFLAMFLVIVIKRLTAQPMAEATSISKSQLLLNRLLFDRDIRDRSIWINRKSIAKQEP